MAPDPSGWYLDHMLHGLTSWVLTDGKAGDELQCLGVAEALGLRPEIRRVRPRAPFAWAMPWGPIDPQERPKARNSPLAPPFPDLLIASGRRAVPYLRHVRKASEGRTFTVFLKDPRTGPRTADLIWVPEHDRLRAENVIVTLTPPHRISSLRLKAARDNPDPRLALVASPRVAVLAGGDSRHHRFTQDDIARFVARLTRLASDGAGLMISTSRRTPEPLRNALMQLARRTRGFFWDGTGENPYVAFLALADAVIVTADSFNMIGEAAATGHPILIFEPSGGHRKLKAFVESLKDQGAVHMFEGRLEGERYAPIDGTLMIAEAIAGALARDRQAHHQALGLSRSDPSSESF